MALRVKLTEGEQARIYAKGTNNLDAYLKVLKGLIHMLSFSGKEENALARQLFEEAIALDPNYANAYALIAWSHRHDFAFRWSKTPKKSLEQAFEFAQKAISLDESESNGHMILSELYKVTGQYEKAIVEGEKALALEPGSADMNAIFALILSYAGRHDEAIERIEKSIRLNPIIPGWYLWNQSTIFDKAGQFEKAITAYKKTIQHMPKNLILIIMLTRCYNRARQYEKAIETAKKALQRIPNSVEIRIELVVANYLSGYEEEARATAKEILEKNPKFSVDPFAKRMERFWKNKADFERYIDALRKAGLK